ncbi:MAG: hypothetical protein AABZ53_13675 [Planctomycetota bacterium]
MYEGPSQAHERSKKPASELSRSAKALLSTVDPADALTELFLGSGLAELRSDACDDIPLPPLRPREQSETPRTSIASLLATPPSTSPGTQASPEPARTPQHSADQEISRSCGHVEVVIVGHLPVLASAWVHQYSRTRQRGLDEPVALLRLRGGSASLDLLSNVPPASLPEFASLESACRAASQLARHWIISTDEVWEPETASRPGVSSVTLLTGANDAALVACYRALKGLCQAGGDALAAALRVVFMGGPQDRATIAAKRIAATAGVFLSRPVSTEVLPDRIGPGRSVPLFVGTCEVAPAEMVARVTALAGSTLETRAAASGVEVPRASTTTGDTLWKRIPGLTGVSPRCPLAPDVELAVGEGGEVHLLSTGSDAASIDRAMGDLAAAGAWVKTNAQVLRAAIPELAKRVQAAAGVTVREHLVTTSPKAARRLLDTPVRVHICVGSQSPLIDLN